MKIVDEAMARICAAFDGEEVYQIAMSKFFVGHKKARKNAAKHGGRGGKLGPRDAAQTVGNRLRKLLWRAKTASAEELKGKADEIVGEFTCSLHDEEVRT